jgi:transmembrane sensor
MNSNKAIKAKIVAHLEGELKGDGLEDLYKWLSKSEDNVRFYAQVKDIWEASIRDVSLVAETQNEWSRFLGSIKKEYQSNIFRYSSNTQIFFRFAAILIIGIIMSGLVFYFTFTKEPVYITAIAPVGSVSQLVLADSTIVYLNAGSQIRYSPETKSKTREVFLEGEAWFEVIKNEDKPFIVHTSYYNVRVTGTRFNVKSYEEDQQISTTLEEGEVVISSSEHFKLAENIRLKPGEQAVFNKKNREILVKRVDTPLFTSWRNNKLTLLNLNVKEMIVLFERKYGVDIIVKDHDILEYHYTGTIKNESLLEMLEIIKFTLPIQYEIEGQKIIISKK